MRVGEYREKERLDGQTIWEFENCHLVILREKKKKAGWEHWEKAVRERNEQVPGYSVSATISQKTELDRLLFYDKSDSNFLQIANEEKAISLSSLEEKKKRERRIIPIGCLKTVDVTDKRHLINSPTPFRGTSQRTLPES